MSDMDDVEAKLLKVKAIKDIDHALDLLVRGPVNNALISAIVAEDAAESERSVRILFTAEESAAIFKAAETALRARSEALKAEVSA